MSPNRAAAQPARQYVCMAVAGLLHPNAPALPNSRGMGYIVRRSHSSLDTPPTPTPFCALSPRSSHTLSGRTLPGLTLSVLRGAKGSPETPRSVSGKNVLLKTSLSDSVKWHTSALSYGRKSCQCQQRAGAKPPWQPAEWEMMIGKRARCRDSVAAGALRGAEKAQALFLCLLVSLKPLSPGSKWNASNVL